MRGGGGVFGEQCVKMTRKVWGGASGLSGCAREETRNVRGVLRGAAVSSSRRLAVSIALG